MADKITTMPDSGSPLAPMSSEPVAAAQEKPKPKTQPKPVKPSSGGPTMALTIILAIVGLLVGAAAGGAGMYFWQQGQLNTDIDQIQQENQLTINKLQGELGDTQDDLQETEAMLAELEVELVTPDISLEPSDDFKFANIMVNDQPIDTVEFGEGIGTLYILKQTKENVYIVAQPETEDLIKRSPWPHNGTEKLYRYNIRSAEFEMVFDIAENVTAIEGESLIVNIESISDDENYVVFTNHNEDEVAVYDIMNETMDTFAVSSDVLTMGDVIMSPNGMKLAYSGVYGEDNAQLGSSVYILDIENNTTEKVATGEDRTYHIVKWEGNENDSLLYYYFPL